MKKLLALSLLISLIASFGSNAQQINYQVTNYNLNQGLLHTDVQTMLQDQTGYLWLGTRSGLQRYDGYSFKNYHISLELSKQGLSNRIKHIQEASSNSLWVTTEGGIYHFDKKSGVFKSLHFPEEQQPDLPKMTFSLDQSCLLTVARNGLFEVCLDEEHQITNVKKVLDLEVHDILQTTPGAIWLMTSNGVWKYHSAENIQQVQLGEHTFSSFFAGHYSPKNGLYLCSGDSKVFKVPHKSLNALNLSENIIVWSLPETMGISPKMTSVYEDVKQQVWIGTVNGLIQTDPNFSSGVRYQRDGDHQWPSTHHITCILGDRTGGMWIGTLGGGLNFIDLTQKAFMTLPLSVTRQIEEKNIRAIQFDALGNLWVGTSAGVYTINMQDYSVRHLEHDKHNPQSICNNNIRCMLLDKFNRVWIGTDGGISIHTGDYRFIELKSYPNNPNSLTHNQIYDMTNDAFGNIWAGSWAEGLNKISFNEDGDFSINRFREGSTHELGLTSNAITGVYADQSRPVVWISTRTGINRIRLNEKGEAIDVLHINSASDSQTLSSAFVMPILQTNDTTIWAGTIGGGLNKIVLKSNDIRIKHFTTEQGAPSNDIESLTLDKHGKLWIGGRGIAQFDPKTEKFINYSTADGLETNSFKPHVVANGPNGQLWFGGVNGINYFYPDSILHNPYMPTVRFTSLKVNNADIETGKKVNGKVILKNNLWQTNTLELDHEENSLTVFFSGFHYSNNEKVYFKYMLEGHQENWITTYEHHADFGNLPVGNYTLMVKASNGENLWSLPAKIKVIVNPPWWQSNAAQNAYFIIAILLLLLAFYLMTIWLRMKKQAEIEKIAHEQSEKMHEMRLDFFTNISHEFRTPLTLILANIHKLEEIANQKSAGEQKLINSISSSAIQLNKLVSELLDFRKAETGHFKLMVNKLDLYDFAKDFAEQFNSLAEERKIGFEKKIHFSSKEVACDPKILQKILFNILSNSFKYTPNGGIVEFECTDMPITPHSIYSHHVALNEQENTHPYFWIRVKDNGMGISEESLPHIFESYFRGNETEKLSNIGYGVGLALVRSLVSLHNGVIHVFSEKGKGTEMFVGIPNSIETLPAEQLQVEMRFEESILKTKTPTVMFQYDKVDIAENTKEHTVMLVEDNPQLLSFLSDHFSDNYNVLQATNGIEALELLEYKYPHIIVSDIMMPEMDGIEMVKNLKENKLTQHIPVVMLTAKNTEKDKVEAAKIGVETFFEKPFNLELMDLKIKQILNARTELKVKYQHDIFVEAREKADNRSDKEFLNEFTKVIEDNISTPNLTVEFICKSLGISRTNLYKKVKAVTGCSINQFIRQAKMKKAALLLSSENLSIQEVMELVGFQSPSYFTRAFKKEYGMPPTKFIQEECRKEEMEEAM
ncbi:two-component regulator propeller domain-containing protein [Limibacter armeniacum]|uniref:hybrid sensor histidine kinase/response regulator transcription factor n=1 Tax=Limibacter armeniacum TaxID=466084 RepID=UPI002FE5386A